MEEDSQLVLKVTDSGDGVSIDLHLKAPEDKDVFAIFTYLHGLDFEQTITDLVVKYFSGTGIEVGRNTLADLFKKIKEVRDAE